MCGLITLALDTILPDSTTQVDEGQTPANESTAEVTQGNEEPAQPLDVNTPEPDSAPQHILDAIEVVASSLGPNSLEIEGCHLQAKENPKGEGVFVFVPETRFFGVERYILWLVLEGTAYPLNGATKDVTPDLPWPREADGDVWDLSNLDKFQATEAIELVFGE